MRISAADTLGMDTTTQRTCPFDGMAVEHVETDGDWPIFQPCGHPAPARAPRLTLADLRAMV